MEKNWKHVKSFAQTVAKVLQALQHQPFKTMSKQWVNEEQQTFQKKLKLSSDETTIFARMMKRDEDGHLKQEKGSRLKFKQVGVLMISTLLYSKSLTDTEKSKEDLKLIYKNGETIKYIPGTNINRKKIRRFSGANYFLYWDFFHWN